MKFETQSEKLFLDMILNKLRIYFEANGNVCVKTYDFFEILDILEEMSPNGSIVYNLLMSLSTMGYLHRWTSKTYKSDRWSPTEKLLQN